MSSIDALKPLNLVLPSGFGYVGLAALGGIWLTFVQGARVGGARKKAGIAYPQMYADKAQEEKSFEARKFNCTQRAHQVSLIHISDCGSFTAPTLAHTHNLFDCDSIYPSPARQNTLEALPAFLVSIFLAGLKFSRAASILGAFWVVGRIAYTIGECRPILS